MYFANAPEWFYIGATTNYKTRIISHKKKLKNNKHTILIMEKCLFFGVENIVFDVVEIVNKNDLSERERYYLQELKPTLNTRPNYSYIRFHDQKTKDKLSSINAGNKMTAEQKQKLSMSMKGIKNAHGAKRSIEFKKAISDRFSKSVIDLNTKTIYKSVNLAAKSKNMKYSTLYSMLSGRKNNTSNMAFYGA
jgi:group I intron endonuclease